MFLKTMNNTNNKKIKNKKQLEGAFWHKHQGFQIKLPCLLLLFPLTKCNIVVNLSCSIFTILCIY